MIVFHKSQILTFYNAYEKSTIEYGLSIYGSTYETHFDDFCKMLKKYVGPLSFKRKADAFRVFS